MIGELSTKTLRSLFGGNISTAQVLQGIASGMASCGVKVIIDPQCTCPYAMVNKKTIVLPAQVKSERALAVVNWFIDHEAGHIIFTDDFGSIIDRWTKGSEMITVLKKHGFNNFPDSLLMAAKGMLNLVEDARIEKLMIQRIPGTKKHFITGPIACDLGDIIKDTLDKAIEHQTANGLPEVPINPFWAAQMHVYHMFDGTHGRHPKNYAHRLLDPYVKQFLDIVDEEFDDIADITKVSTGNLATRTDKAMARIMDLVLDQAADEEDGNDDGEGGEGESDSQNPFQNKFSKSKKKSKGKGQSIDSEESGESGGDGEQSEDGDKKQDKSSNSGSEEGEEDEESDESGGGGEGEDDSEDEEEGESSGGGGKQGDEGEDDEESSGEESDEDSDEGDSSDPGESDENGVEQPETLEDAENDANATPKQLPKQIEEWAKDAQADMAEMMRGSEEANQGEAGGNSDGNGRNSGNPECDGEASADGMPDRYFQNMGKGVRSFLIAGADIEKLRKHTSGKFQVYDDLIRKLMPPNLGPASRRLVGKFKDAPGEAYVGKRINPRKVAQIKAGHAYGKKLFMRRNQTMESKRGLAVMLMIDCSGSMSSGVYGLKTGDSLTNSKFALAHAAARSLARLLQSVNVPFAVGGFTTTDTEHYSYNASRSLDLVNFLFKDFHEPWAASEQNMLAMNTFSTYKYQGKDITSHCNSDGESILWAAGHLLLREEDTKVLIVLSDGLPAGGNSTLQAGFLKWVVKRVIISGVKIGALGLGCEDVKFYYPVHETLSQFPEGSGTAETAPLYLQEKVIGLVNKLMTSEEKV